MKEPSYQYYWTLNIGVTKEEIKGKLEDFPKEIFSRSSFYCICGGIKNRHVEIRKMFRIPNYDFFTYYLIRLILVFFKYR